MDAVSLEQLQGKQGNFSVCCSLIFMLSGTLMEVFFLLAHPSYLFDYTGYIVELSVLCCVIVILFG